MKLGLYLATQFTPETNVAPELSSLIEQTRVARKCGYTSLWVPHHYLTAPMQMLQPFTLLAYLLREAEGMTIGPNILIMPLLNPVHVAEEAATLDFLSGGRFVLGLGLGYRDGEFTAFNVPLKHRVKRLTESIELIRRLWTEDRVTYHGEIFTVEDLGIGLKSQQKGGPPIWVAAVVDSAVKRAAAIGDAWIITNFSTIQTLTEQMKLYRQALREAQKPDPEDFPITRECYVAKNHKTALEECRVPLQYKYRAYSSWGLDKVAKNDETFNQPFEDFVRDRFIIGDKSFVKEELLRYKEALGVNHFVMRVQWPGLERERALHTIEALAEVASEID